MSTFQSLGPAIAATLAPIECPAGVDVPDALAAAVCSLGCCVPLVLVVLFWLKAVTPQHAVNWSAASFLMAPAIALAWWVGSGTGKKYARAAEACQAQWRDGQS